MSTTPKIVYCINSSETSLQMSKVYAVIGGWDYEGEHFNSLRLFDCHSAAEEYYQHLINEDGFDYAKIQVRQVEMHSLFAR